MYKIENKSPLLGHIKKNPRFASKHFESGRGERFVFLHEKWAKHS